MSFMSYYLNYQFFIKMGVLFIMNYQFFIKMGVLFIISYLL